MELRSGRNTGKSMSSYRLHQTAKALMKLPPKVSTAKSYGWYQSSVNEKIKTAPEVLKQNCEYCLRQVIEESVLRGINIKFESLSDLKK